MVDWSDANGDFLVEKLRGGRYVVKVDHVGYRTLTVSVSIGTDGLERDLGNLKLEADTEVLKEVEILGEKNQAVLQVDRRVYNVDKDLSVRGGTAEDVMQNIPGLDVDPDGNVELRGRSPRLFVDGRPSLLTLDQIPADEIERVEVITNPSVLFDAGSTGGILNVVLKQSTRAGYSGSVQLGVGTNERYNTRGDLWIKESKYSVNLNLGYSFRNRPTDGFTSRQDLLNGEIVSGFEQDSENESQSTRLNGRLGFNYKIDNRNSFNAQFGIYSGEYDTFSDQTSVTSDGLGTSLQTGIRLSDQVTDYTSISSRIGFKRNSPRVGKFWTVDLSYNVLERNTFSRFDDSSVDQFTDPIDSLRNTQVSQGGTNNDQITLQFDAVDPYADNRKIEWGFKGSYKDENSILDVTNTGMDGVTLVDSSLSNDYHIVDIINAAYFNYTTALNDRWSVQAGLRLEQTWFEAELVDKEQSFEYKYPNGTDDLAKAIFPAIYFSHKWDGEREMQINFSRKIDRPNFWQVMPFIFTSDQRSIRIGNPTLAPEFSNLAEVNHLLPFGKKGNDWLSSIYTRITEDVITSYAYTDPDDPDILVSSYLNGETSFNYGWENTVRLKPTQAFDITLSGNLQWVDISLNSGSEIVKNSGINWNSKASVKYKIKKDLSVQANGRFRGPRILPQGERQAQYTLDLSVNKKIKRKWDFNLSVRDVFNSRYWWSIYDTPTFYQESRRRRDTRHLMFSVTYRFGQTDASLFRRRPGNSQRREPGSDSDGGEGF